MNEKGLLELAKKYHENREFITNEETTKLALRGNMWLRGTVLITLGWLVVGCSSDSNEKATGTEGGPCYGNGTCDPRLTCASNLCVRLADQGVLDLKLPDVAQPDLQEADLLTPDLLAPDLLPADLAAPDVKADSVPCDCLISSVCYGSGAVDPANKCRKCDPSSSTTSWTSFAVSGCIITLAGTGAKGFADGPALAAEFNAPTGIAVDASNKVYVADPDNNRVRVIAAGVVSTMAGSGASGFSDGAAASAMFSQPEGVAVDGAGKVFVADTQNQRVRMISGGQVSTAAGSGAKGFLNGASGSAQFNLPHGVAVDGSGAVYVADDQNARIRKIYGGQVSTLAGSGTHGFADGTVASAAFYNPHGVGVTTSGNVIVGDWQNFRVRLISGGQVTTLAGSGQVGFLDGAAASAKFYHPWGVAADGSGKVYVADRYNARIRVVSAGQVTTLVGSPGVCSDGPLASAKLAAPVGVAVGSDGKVYVADQGCHKILMVVP